MTIKKYKTIRIICEVRAPQDITEKEVRRQLNFDIGYIVDKANAYKVILKSFNRAKRWL